MQKLISRLFARRKFVSLLSWNVTKMLTRSFGFIVLFLLLLEHVLEKLEKKKMRNKNVELCWQHSLEKPGILPAETWLNLKNKYYKPSLVGKNDWVEQWNISNLANWLDCSTHTKKCLGQLKPFLSQWGPRRRPVSSSQSKDFVWNGGDQDQSGSENKRTMKGTIHTFL